MDNEGHFYTITDLSKILNVSEKTIRRHINSGKLKSQKIGGVHRIQKADLDFFLNPNYQRPSEKIRAESAPPFFSESIRTPDSIAF